MRLVSTSKVLKMVALVALIFFRPAWNATMPMTLDIRATITVPMNPMNVIPRGKFPVSRQVTNKVTLLNKVI